MSIKLSQNVGVLIISVICIGIISALIWVPTKKNPADTKENTFGIEHLHLLEVRTNDKLEETIVYGQIVADKTITVEMEVNGKIDIDNTALNIGETFKKNDILIKVDRTEILYELLAIRSNFKKKLLVSLKEIGDQFPNEIKKWSDFTNSISRTSRVPELPQMSKEEESLIAKLEILGLYYNIKIVEQKAEKYIYAAPFDGVIIDSKVQPGSMVKQSSKLLTIAKQNDLIIKSVLPFSIAKEYQSNPKDFDVFVEGKAVGKAKYNSISAIETDTSQTEIKFTTSLQQIKYLNEIVELTSPVKQRGIWVPSSSLTSDSLIIIFKDNQLLSLPVSVLQGTKDSIRLDGLPNHFFLVTNPTLMK